MKKIKQISLKIYPVIGSLLVLIAVYGGVKPASLFNLYQPRVPKQLI